MEEILREDEGKTRRNKNQDENQNLMKSEQKSQWPLAFFGWFIICSLRWTFHHDMSWLKIRKCKGDRESRQKIQQNKHNKFEVIVSMCYMVKKQFKY